MDILIGFFRDTLSGIPYLVTVIISIFLIFTIIGYLYKSKYDKMISIKSVENVGLDNDKKEEIGVAANVINIK